MKKVFLAIAVASVFTACNNGGEATTPATDTAKAATVDTAKPATVDTAKAATVDTAKKAVDTAKAAK